MLRQTQSTLCSCFQLALLAGLLLGALACGGDDSADAVCNFNEGQGTCVVAMKTGETLRVKLPNSYPGEDVTEVGPWNLLAGLNVQVLEVLDSTGLGSREAIDVTFRAVGPGEQSLTFSAAFRDNGNFRTLKVELTVTGDPIGGAGSDAYLDNIEFVGGKGASVVSGDSLQNLSLWPTDLVARGANLWIVSEGRLWSIDTKAETGTIVLDTDAAGTAWPSGGTLHSVAPLADGGFLASIGGLPTGVVVRIGADLASYTEVVSAVATDLVPTCTNCDAISLAPGRIRANDEGSKWIARIGVVQAYEGGFIRSDALGTPIGNIFDGDGVLTDPNRDGSGLDKNGRVLYWHGSEDGYQRLDPNTTGLAPNMSASVRATGGDILRFSVRGMDFDEIYRDTDFLPTLAQIFSPLYQMPDSSYWTHSFVDIDGIPTARGIFVHR